MVTLMLLHNVAQVQRSSGSQQLISGAGKLSAAVHVQHSGSSSSSNGLQAHSAKRKQRSKHAPQSNQEECAKGA
jgi:hypothetical protein